MIFVDFFVEKPEVKIKEFKTFASIRIKNREKQDTVILYFDDLQEIREFLDFIEYQLKHPEQPSETDYIEWNLTTGEIKNER